jgi:opacity protein-like surface antigen
LKLRFAVYLVALLCFGAGISRAQRVPTLEIALDYSHMSVSPTSSLIGNFSMNGASGQIAYNFNKWISAVGDAGYYTMNPTASSATIGLTIHGTEISYLLGPRVAYRHWARFTPFAQILVGMVHDTPSTLDDPFKSQFKLGYDGGAGIDVRVTPHIAIRPVAIDVMRTQFAELGSFRQVQTNLRYSAGVVFRF